MDNRIFLVALGGAIGSVTRLHLADWSQRATAMSFPLGTLLVNATGCFLIGYLNAALLGRWSVPEPWRAAVFAGLLGGFTTFSAFGWDTAAHLHQGRWTTAAANVVLTNGLCLALVISGYRLGRFWPGG